jgi:GMP synthase-like glutamine amidotransferase
MRVLVVEHAEHEGAGHIGRVFAAAGATLDVRRMWRGDALPDAPDDAAALIVLGGAMSALDDDAHPYLPRAAALLAESARAGRLTLGICLGAQLLARGLGARVRTGPAPELGIVPLLVNPLGMADPLLSTCAGQSLLQWHGDTFELPAGAELLAASELYPHQAFRVGRRAWGVQFHPECDLAMRSDWARRGRDELLAAGVDPATLSAPQSTALDRVGRAFAERLLALI